MERYTYIGRKPHRRIVAVIHENHKIAGYEGFWTSYSEQHVEELAPGTIVEDLSPAELEAFGDLFTLVVNEPPAAPTPPPPEGRHTRRTP